MHFYFVICHWHWLGWCWFSGLFLTYLGLYIMNGHGQPALLYLVPCTLGNIFTLMYFLVYRSHLISFLCILYGVSFTFLFLFVYIIVGSHALFFPFSKFSVFFVIRCYCYIGFDKRWVEGTLELWHRGISWIV